MRLLRPLGIAFFLVLTVSPVAALDAPLPGKVAPQASAERLRNDLSAVVDKHQLKRFWFRLEDQGRALADLALNGAQPDQPTPIGSLSKSITAIAIALLIQDNRLALHEPVGRLLAPAYARAGRAMPPGLAEITIERLLTHTAGLPGNSVADPKQGIASDPVLEKLGPNPTPLDFLAASKGDVVNGKSEFLYSNMDYLLLGLVIESVSGESYESFVRRRIFAPLQIEGARLLDGRHALVAPYAGWVMTRAAIMTVWRRVFDRRNPTILTRETLDKTLFAPLGPLVTATRDAHYTLGVYVRVSYNPPTYRIWHNGIQSTRFDSAGDTGRYYSFLRSDGGRRLWMFATSPVPKVSAWPDIASDVREVVDRVR